MKKHFLLLLLALVSLTAVAQNVHFKVGGGLASHFGADSHCVGAFKIGVGYEWEWGQHWSFTPGLEFYGKGWKQPNECAVVYDTEGEPVVGDDGVVKTGVVSRSATQNYVSLPLMFSYFVRTGEARYVILAAGPYLAYGVSGKQKIKGDTRHAAGERYYYERRTFEQEGVHRFDCGVQVFAGYQFASGVSVGVEADFGLTKFSTDGARNVSGLLSLGYKL